MLRATRGLLVQRAMIPWLGVGIAVDTAVKFSSIGVEVECTSEGGWWEFLWAAAPLHSPQIPSQDGIPSVQGQIRRE